MVNTDNPRARGPVLAVLMAMVAGLAAVAFVLAASAPADATTQFRIVTRTFNKPAPILIPDAGSAAPYPSSIPVTGLRQGRILDVNVILRGFIHTFPDDVDTALFGPQGTGSARIMSDAGAGLDVSGVNMVVDDEAPIFMPDNGQLVSTRYMPSNYATILDPMPAIAPNGNRLLSTFDGKNPNGNWRFFVADEAPEDTGQFAGGWSVVIRARVAR
jgi:hypothetical protein